MNNMTITGFFRIQIFIARFAELASYHEFSSKCYLHFPCKLFMIMINMTPIFPTGDTACACTWAGHRLGRSCDDMRNFYQQMSCSSDAGWADTKWTVWTESEREGHHMMIGTLDTLCHNNNLNIDLRRYLRTYMSV